MGGQSASRDRADIHREGSLAWSELTRGRAEVIGVALGVGESVIQKQGRPHEPHRPANVALVLGVQAGLDDGADPAEAYAPLDWAERRLGRIALPLPSATASDDDLARGIARAAHEFGDLLSAAARRLAERRRPLTSEIEELERELQESIRASLELVAAIKSYGLTGVCEEPRL